MSTLTPLADMAPVPRVLVDVPVSEFPAGAVTVSLQRTCEERTMSVRGGQRLPATSPMIVVDPEAAFGIESAYTVLGHDASGTVMGSRPVGSTVLDFGEVVIQQPLDARLSVRVGLLGGTGAELERETPGELVYPQAAVLPGLVGLGPRRGVQNVPLEILVDSHDAANTLQAALGTYDTYQLPILLMRCPPGRRLPAVFFFHVPRLRERDDFVQMGLRYLRYSAEVTEVRPPAAGITATAPTHSDVKVFYAKHSEVKAQYTTHSDIKRDTSLIGAADA